MALSAPPQSNVPFAAPVPAKAEVRSDSAPVSIRRTPRSEAPDVRWMLALSIGVAAITAVLVFILLAPSASNFDADPAARDLSSLADGDRAGARNSAHAPNYFDPEARKIGDTIVSRNNHGLIEREEDIFSDGSSEITTYYNDPKKHQVRITVYRRDGSTFSKDFTYGF